MGFRLSKSRLPLALKGPTMKWLVTLQIGQVDDPLETEIEVEAKTIRTAIAKAEKAALDDRGGLIVAISLID